MRKWQAALDSMQQIVNTPEDLLLRTELPPEALQDPPWRTMLCMSIKQSEGNMAIQVAEKHQPSSAKSVKVFSVQDEELLILMGREITSSLLRLLLREEMESMTSAMSQLHGLVGLMGRKTQVLPLEKLLEQLCVLLSADACCWLSSPEGKVGSLGEQLLERQCSVKCSGCKVEIKDPAIWPNEISESLGAVGRAFRQGTEVLASLERDPNTAGYFDPQCIFSEGTDAPQGSDVSAVLALPLHPLGVDQSDEDVALSVKPVGVLQFIRFASKFKANEAFGPVQVKLAKAAASLTALRFSLLDSKAMSAASSAKFHGAQEVARLSLDLLRDLKVSSPGALEDFLGAARTLVSVRLVSLTFCDPVDGSLRMLGLSCEVSGVRPREGFTKAGVGLIGQTCTSGQSRTCAVNTSKLKKSPNSNAQPKQSQKPRSNSIAPGVQMDDLPEGFSPQWCTTIPVKGVDGKVLGCLLFADKIITAGAKKATELVALETGDLPTVAYIADMCRLYLASMSDSGQEEINSDVEGGMDYAEDFE